MTKPNGRPRAKVLIETVVGRGKPKRWTVQQATSMYAVVYDGDVINVRHEDAYVDGVIKYRRITYASLGQAKLEATKLNTIFNSNRFGIVELTARKIE